MAASHGVDVWTTEDVDAARSFEYWQDAICDTFVQLSASPVGGRPFAGQIAHRSFDGFEISTVRAGGQRVRRTPGLIARGDEAYLLASIQVSGSGRVEQEGRSAALRPGTMAFYDSTKPYVLHFEDDFEQIVVQVPREVASSLSGVQRTWEATARPVGDQDASRAVVDFFRSLTRTDDDPAGTRIIASSAVALFSSALALAGGTRPAEHVHETLSREQVVAYLRDHLSDPRLDADGVALALFVSRRTLYRQFADEPDGPMGLLRRMRIEHGRRLLVLHPRRSVREIADRCGFSGDAQFHRAFRAATGMTPADYRAAELDGTDRRHDGTQRR